MHAHARNLGISLGTLLASSATLVCCVLPAVLVSLGAGATLLSLVSALPQLIWLSEQKVLVFSLAALLLAVSGVMLWRARLLPCPVAPAEARACKRLRRTSLGIYATAVVAFAVGAAFAFLLPALRG